MDTGCLIPFFYCGEEVIGDPLQPYPIKILLLREIFLIAVLALKIAKIGDMPLNMEGIFFYGRQIFLPLSRSLAENDPHLFKFSLSKNLEGDRIIRFLLADISY